MNSKEYTQFLSIVENRLSQELPGITAHNIMAPYSRVSHKKAKESHPNAKEAGVLKLLYPKDNNLHFALIKRPPYDGVHGAQVSFPGGKKEANEILSETALRETEEEIGVLMNEITLLGALTPIYIPPSKMLVHPFIGWLDETPSFKKDDREVEYIIEISLQQLLDPNSVQQMNMQVGKSPNKMTMKNVPYFAINDEIIWGATAMMLSESKEFFKSIGLPF